jgi:UDP-N-acetylmuramate-alanine ligase
VAAQLRDDMQPGDVVLTMGAGDIYRLARLLSEETA